MPKKKTTKPADRPILCPECKAPRKARGYAHVDGCSLSSRQPGAGTPRSKGGLPTANQLWKHPVESLIEFRGTLDESIKNKAGEVKMKIAELQELYKTIK